MEPTLCDGLELLKHLFACTDNRALPLIYRIRGKENAGVIELFLSLDALARLDVYFEDSLGDFFCPVIPRAPEGIRQLRNNYAEV